MPGIFSPILGPGTDPGVGLVGITAPYRAHGFGNGYIPSSTPFVEDLYSLRLVFTPVVTLMGVVVDTSFECVVMMNPPYTLWYGIFTECFQLFWTNIIVM